MKRIFLALVFVGLAGLVSGQDFEVRISDKTNKKIGATGMVRIVEGVQEGQLLVVEPKLKTFVGPFSNPVKSVRVRLCDLEWKETKCITLDDTKKNAIEDAFRIGNSLHVLVSYTEKKQLRLRHVVLDAQTLDISTDEVLYSAPIEKKGEGRVWTASSPNGRYHGAVCAVWPKEGDGMAMALMFDSAMNKLWQQPLYFSNISDVMVNDSGMLATLQAGFFEDNDAVTPFRLNVADGKGVKHGDFVLNARVGHSALMNFTGNRLVAVALEESGVWKYTGLWSMVFNLQEGAERLSGSRHPFTDEELRLFSNDAPDESVSSRREAESLRLVDCCPTPQGGAAVYQRTWQTAVRNIKTGMTSNESFHSVGLLLVQVDMNGRITTHRIPQRNQNANFPKVGADIFVHGDRLYVVTNESKEESDVYNPDQPAKRSGSLIMANCALAVYWFTPDGQGAKKVVEREHKAILISRLFAGSNNRFYFLATSLAFPHMCSVVLPKGR